MLIEHKSGMQCSTIIAMKVQEWHNLLHGYFFKLDKTTFSIQTILTLLQPK